jgi:hypothetical protein
LALLDSLVVLLASLLASMASLVERPGGASTELAILGRACFENMRKRCFAQRQNEHFLGPSE